VLLFVLQTSLRFFMTSKALPVAVRVRALAASAQDGSWCVIGYPGATDEELVEDARLLVGDGEMRHHWIEMELELPNQ
jgi:hypothetical protein